MITRHSFAGAVAAAAGASLVSRPALAASADRGGFPRGLTGSLSIPCSKCDPRHSGRCGMMLTFG